MSMTTKIAALAVRCVLILLCVLGGSAPPAWMGEDPDDGDD